MAGPGANAETEFEVKPIRALTLKSQIAHQLRTAILQGRLGPGTRVVESRLAKQLGVAQTTVREAILELENQGLFIKYVNRETRVRKLTIADLSDLFRVRVQLEGLAVEIGHANANETTLAPLYQTVEEMRRSARREEISEFYRFDIEVHRQLWCLAQNGFLEKSLAPLLVGPIAFVLAGVPAPIVSNYVQVAEDHAQILDVLRRESAADARRLMQSKLTDWHELQMQTLTK